jgi:hypothetical protein
MTAKQIKYLQWRVSLALDKATADAAGENCRVPDLQQWICPWGDLHHVADPVG